MSFRKPNKTTKLKIFNWLIIAFALLAALHSVYYADTPQIDMRAVVTVMGLDYAPGDIYKATAHVIVPVTEGNTKSSQDIIEADGSSVMEAIDNFNVINGSKVETSQCGMIIFGKSICEKDILTPVKSLLASGMVSAGVILISADKLEAKEFLDRFSKMSKESSSNLNSFTSFFENSLYMPSLTMTRFLSESITESNASFLPSIELNKDKNESKDSGGGGDSGGGESSGGKESGGGSGGESNTKIRDLSSVVVFKHGKRVGMLDREESEGLSWIDGKSKRGFLQVSSFEAFGREYRDICGEVSSKNTFVKYKFKDGKPEIRVKVRARINLIDRHMFNYELDKSRISEKEYTAVLSRYFADKIRAEIDAAVSAVKRFDSDFMHLKYGFYRLQYHKIREYESNPYNDFINDLNVTYDIKCDVR